MPVFSSEGDLSRFQWIVFDAVGTLIQPNPAVAVAYQTIAAKYGSRLTVAEASERFRRAFHLSETSQFPGGPAAGLQRLSSDTIEIARWRWIVSEVISDVDRIDDCFVELWDHFASGASWSCFDDVGATLTFLRQHGYRVAIASNFDSRLHAVCDQLPSLAPIERRFVSSETGFRKPAPEFYAHVISELGCPSSEILMIGDDHDHDVAGPNQAGMQALLIDRRTMRSDAKTISSLDELIKWLSQEKPEWSQQVASLRESLRQTMS